jgi:hypothetical protein
MPDNSLKVKFNFFQIQKSSNFPYGIHQVLSNIMARGTAERQQNVNGSLRILDGAPLRNSLGISYLFRSKRIRGVPSKSDKNWEMSSLGLAPSEALDEPVSMAVNPSGDVAAVSSNRHAIYPNTICQYLNLFAQGASFTFVPALTINALTRLANAREVRKAHVKFAGALDYQKLSTGNISTDEAMAIRTLFSSPTMELTWSAGRTRAGLPEVFRNILNCFKTYHDETDDGAISSLDATIQEDIDGHLKCSSIDLLTDRIVSFQDVSLTPGRELDRHSLLSAGISALEEKADELAIYITPQESN